jgi:predicted metal-dependent phosphotriesterase family hydrolase
MLKESNRQMKINRRGALRMLAFGVGAGAILRFPGKLGLSARAASKVTFPKGSIIRTILKDVTPESLGGGATLFHEHITISDPVPSWLPPRKNAPPPAYGSKIDLMVEEVKALSKDGVSCIVDGSTVDLGKNMEHLKEIATRTGFPIVAAGGYYLHATYPPEVAEKSEDELAQKLISDGAAQRWGAMGEIGVTQHPILPDEQKVLRAVCKTHLTTGLPIFTHNPHTGCGPCGVDQLDIIESMGVNPVHVCIGHLADITDDPKAETHKSIAKRGAFLGFDTVGRRLTQPDSKKLEMLLAVIEAGYEDHVLLGSDFATEDELKANHGAGFDSALIVFVPKMRAAGVKEETIHKIVVDNPRRFLAFVPKKAT